MNRSAALVLLGLALGTGCSKKPEPELSAAASAAPAVTSAPAPPISTASAAAQRLLSLNQRFEREAGQRPKDTPRVEDVLAAFEQQGLTCQDRRQHLAAPFRARYCFGARTDHDVAISICEYGDAHGAKLGRDESLKAFSAVQNREIFLNRSTTLTLRQGRPTAASQAVIRKLVEAFSKVPLPAAPAPSASASAG
jgi:hypothetical protein